MTEKVLRVIGCINREWGQGLAEYSLILAFVVMACVLALGALGVALAGQIDSIAGAFP